MLRSRGLGTVEVIRGRSGKLWVFYWGGLVFRDTWKWEAVGGIPGLYWFGLKVLEASGKHWVGY